MTSKHVLEYTSDEYVDFTFTMYWYTWVFFLIIADPKIYR